MNIPGVNIMGLALSVIRPQPVQWAAFTGRTTNAAGLDVPTWAAPVAIRGSVQDVDRAQMQTLGLDMLQEYVNVYTSNPVKTVQRDGSGDRIIYNGNTYSCESSADWYAQDGWVAVLCVKVPA